MLACRYTFDDRCESSIVYAGSVALELALQKDKTTGFREYLKIGVPSLTPDSRLYEQLILYLYSRLLGSNKKVNLGSSLEYLYFALQFENSIYLLTTLAMLKSQNLGLIDGFHLYCFKSRRCTISIKNDQKRSKNQFNKF